MGKITLKQAAKWCGGRIDPKYADVTFFGAHIDSRYVEPGELFVAIKNTRDGHEFIPAAMKRGASAVLCNHCDGDYPAIIVEDTRVALGQIAKGERKRLGIKVVGVTGSVGKSTTKEMIADVLETTYRTGRSPVNFNNDLGLPMSILGLPDDTEVAVLEMGMNHFREIGYLTSIARPELGVIINIGTMHIEHLGSMEGILQAKLEILEGMPENGRLFMNGDDQLLWNAQRISRINVQYFGECNPDCTIRGSNVTEKPGSISYKVTKGTTEFIVDLPLEGLHYVPDSLAAVSIGLEMGVPTEKIQEALSHFQNIAGRQEMLHANGCTIIKDCYNAGPESMAAALAVLGNQPGRHIAVLGDMLELGVCAQAEHYKIGRIAAEKASVVLAYGQNSSRVVNGAITGGMSQNYAKEFEDKSELVATLKHMVKPGDVLLFKGSHGMHMEQVLDEFLKNDDT